ncbi:glycosyltransferase family 2 protein [Baekduia soli]|uniref:glycosyltransferase family 2 protein n=1 Tax=Baekduia soli TaxID=496014 RepID=UPI0016527E08|nr:glycosyltransferase family 2 protein [Baekduia soli]
MRHVLSATTCSVTEAPHLSLVLPAYRAAAFIEENVRTVNSVLEELGRPFEVIVVVDGAIDDTTARVRGLGDPRVSAIEYGENQGKGFALCVGVAHARGRLVGWLDADLDVHPSVIVAAAHLLQEHEIDAVVGSKRHADSQVEYPAVRRVLSLGFQMLVRAALRVDVRDTQTGAKLFRREVLDTVIPLLLIKRYAFDLEVLAVASLFGFDRVEEVPIQLDYRFAGTGIDSEAVRRMFMDTLAIAYRVRLRHWYVRQYAALQRARVNVGDGPVADLPTVPASNLAVFQALLPDDPAIEGRAGEPV